MISWKQFTASIKNLYFSENRFDLTRVQRSAVYIIRYIFHIGREISRDQCLLRASALAFTTMMTLMPVAILVFVMFRAFGDFDEATQRVQGFLFQHLLPDSVASVQDFIQELMSDFDVQAVSYISIIFFIAAAYGLSSSIDSSMNVIWGVRKPRRVFRNLVSIWFILTVAPVLMGYSLYLTTQLEKVRLMGLGVFTSRVLTGIMPYFLTLLSFLLLYKLVPRTRVTWVSAFLGALFASIFWEISKYGLNYYVQNLSNYRILYGSFLTVPVFFIWINLSWLIVLVGAEIAYTHQNLEHLHLINKRDEKAKSNVFLLSEKLGFYLFFLIVEDYMSGTPLDRRNLHRQAPGSGWMVDTFLDRFQKQGLLIIDPHDRIVPARDPSMIRISDVFDFFEPDEPDQFWSTLPGRSQAARTLLQELRDVRWKTFSTRDIRTAILRVRDTREAG
jgi:membrane protein